MKMKPFVLTVYTRTHTLHEYMHTHVKSRKANEESHCCANNFLTVGRRNMWQTWPPRLVMVQALAAEPVVEPIQKSGYPLLHRKVSRIAKVNNLWFQHSATCDPGRITLRWTDLVSLICANNVWTYARTVCRTKAWKLPWLYPCAQRITIKKNK